MNLWKKLSVLKARLRGWYSALFGKRHPAGTPEPEDTGTATDEEVLPTDEPGIGDTDTPPADAPAEDDAGSSVETVAPDGLVAAVCGRLEHLRRQRIMSVRKKSNRMEWQAFPADFTDAYLFLLGIPGADIRRLRHRTAADDITYRMDFPDGTAAELTDKTQSAETTAVFRLTAGGTCLLTINFINPKK